MRNVYKIFLFLFMSFIIDIINAQSCAPSASYNTVAVNPFVNLLYDIDFTFNTFTSEFYVTFISTFVNTSPQLFYYPADTIAIENVGPLASVITNITTSNHGGSVQILKFVAQIEKIYDVTYYPFDTQVFQIQLMDPNYGIDNIQFTTTNNGVYQAGESNHIGWTIYNVIVSTPTVTFQSPTFQGYKCNQFSTILISVAAVRAEGYLFALMFIPICIVMIIVFGGYLFHPNMIIVKLNLILIAMFNLFTLGVEYVLPGLSVFSIGFTQGLGFLIIIISICEVVVVLFSYIFLYWLYKTYEIDKLYVRITKIVAGITIGIYLFVIFIICLYFPIQGQITLTDYEIRKGYTSPSARKIYS